MLYTVQYVILQATHKLFWAAWEFIATIPQMSTSGLGHRTEGAVLRPGLIVAIFKQRFKDPTVTV